MATPYFLAILEALFFSGNKHAITSNKTMNLSASTFIAWVNPSQMQSGWNGIIFSRAGYGGSDVGATGMNLCSTNGIGYHWGNTELNCDSRSTIVPNNEWSMIALTITANSATTCLLKSSGVTFVSYSRSNPALSGIFNFYIGCEPYDPASRAFVGKIATSLVYNRALTQTEISTIFDSQKVKFGIN